MQRIKRLRESFSPSREPVDFGENEVAAKAGVVGCAGGWIGVAV
jgi:hypothetical protein